MTDYWFKPKPIGYGATPANWKGWLATFVFIAAMVVVTLPFLWLPAEREAWTTWVAVPVWLAAVLGLTWQFTKIARAKTDGEWKLRFRKPLEELLAERDASRAEKD